MTPVHLAKLVDGMKADDILTHKAQSLPPCKAQKIPATPLQTSAPQPLTITPSELVVAESETHSIVRGFSPAHISSSIRSHKAQSPEPKKKNMWIIGSTSSDGSSCMDEYPQQRKRASFKEEVVTRTVYDDDDEYTTEEEDVDESAIDDDDESDWDSVSESMSSSYEQRNMFQRREELAAPKLPSRRSLLSTLLCEPHRALTNAGSRSTPALRSRTTTPQGPSVAPSPSQDSPISLLGGLKMTTARAVMATANIHPPALSPRTTRRNMLATELTESLRQNLLWERKQKDTTAQAVLKRRHTAHTEMSKLTEYPQLSHMSNKDTSKNNSWNHFFDGLNEYHTKGW